MSGRPPLLQAMGERVLLADGAMGTEIQQAGLESGGCGEAWNLDHAERVLAIQRRYVEAGSDVLLSHTFGACRIMLERHVHPFIKPRPGRRSRRLRFAVRLRLASRQPADASRHQDPHEYVNRPSHAHAPIFLLRRLRSRIPPH